MSPLSQLRRFGRRFMLQQLSRQKPDKLLDLSRGRLERCFERAARVSPAYRTLLAEAGLAGDGALSAQDIVTRAPLLDKSNTFGRFTITELLAEDIPLSSIAGVLTSSGQGGKTFGFGLSTRAQMDASAGAIDLGLQLAFGIDERSTLLVNCLPMGVVFTSRTVTVANVSVREDMALAIVRQAMPLYEQLILCVDPLFFKRLLDHAQQQGFDWSGIRTNVILGEETFSEDFRSYVAGRLHAEVDGAGADDPLIGSSMGAGELGLNLFFETRETIALRRAHHRRDPGAVLPVFFCYDPMRTFVEIHAPDADGVGELVITVLDAKATIPLIRYCTGDLARWLTEDDYAVVPADVRVRLRAQPLPMIAMLGRKRDWIDARWHVDHFKSLLYRRPELADLLSGAFRVFAGEPAPVWEVQLRRDAAVDPQAMAEALAALVGEQCEQPAAAVPTVRCHRYEAFPYGMSLDYERKFAYIGAR
ncbi:hypothetical protein [Thauera propionica]|uniref:hypothetical protein n=1 Tax=Thauera propionica TaxID=2019431 RepID=UPI0023F05526|nr:hypothetical protein [Thauera propionica]MDD3675192.1 hypothetical protein [Thauera propionica]